MTRRITLAVVLALALAPRAALAQAGLFQEDAAHVSGHFGTFILGVRNDAGTSLCGTTGDYCPFQLDASGQVRVVAPLPAGAATETTLAGIKTGTDKIPASPATDRTTAAGPFALRLSDGSAFYDATKTGQLPAALVSGRLDVNLGASGITLPVSGTFFQATQPVSIAATVTTDVSDRAARDMGKVDIASLDQYTPVSGRLPVDGSGVTQPVSGSLTVSGTVTANAGTGTLQVNCVSGCTAGGSFADAAAFTFGTTAVGNMGAVVDDTATNTVAENSAGAPRMNTNRILYSNLRNNAGTEVGTSGAPLRTDPTGSTTQPVSGSVTVSGTVTANLAAGTNNIGDVDVLTLPALPAGTNNIGDVDVLTLPSVTIGTFPDNEPFNLAQVGGATVQTGNGTASGAQRFSLASDSTGNIATIGTSVTPGTAAANLGKAEDAGHTSGDVGVAALAVRTDPTTTALTSANAEYSAIGVDYVGAVYEGAHPGRFSCFVPISATATTQCQAAPAAGLRAYVTSLQCSNGAATVQGVDVVFGTGAACVTGITALTHKFQMGTNALTTSPFIVSATWGENTPLVPTAANAICVRPTAATAFGCTLTGYIAP